MSQSEISSLFKKSSNFFSPAFYVPDEYEDVNIKEISVFDINAQSPGLKLLDVNHCFCLILLANGKRYKMDAGKNEKEQMDVSYTPYVPNGIGYFITKVKLSKTVSFKELGNFIKKTYFSSRYDIIGNNCFDVAIKILIYLGFKSESEKVNKRKRQHLETGVGNSYGIIGFVALGTVGFIYGAVTKNWTPLVDLAKHSNFVSSYFKLAGVGVSKFSNKLKAVRNKEG